jgi:hypothetical protein
MPTEAVETVLNRDLSRVAAKKEIATATALLTELVNEGTCVFKRCEASSSGDLADTPLLMLYLHMLEMVDGIQVLVAESCVAPAIPLVRSAYEACLSIEYILESESERRALSWLAAHALSGVQVNERFDGTTAEGKKYQTVCAADETTNRIDFARLAPLAATKLAEYRSLLGRAEFVPILAELQRVSTPKGRHPKWFSLFGGPSNLRELAKRLKSEGQYLTLYGHWSRVSHAEDYARFARRDASADPTIRLIRDSSQMTEIVGFAASFMLRATRLVLGKFRPSENIATWYLREVKPFFLPTGFSPPTVP